MQIFNFQFDSSSLRSEQRARVSEFNLVSDCEFKQGETRNPNLGIPKSERAANSELGTLNSESKDGAGVADGI